jgi:hypothetical protein
MGRAAPVSPTGFSRSQLTRCDEPAVFAPPSQLRTGPTSSFPSDFTAEVYTASEAREFITGLHTDDSGGDEVSAKSAAAFAKITRGLHDNLTDLKVVKIGPKEGDGSLASAGGLYAKLIIGRTADGKVAGILLGSVET